MINLAKNTKSSVVCSVLLIYLLAGWSNQVTPFEVECGQILEAEFTEAQQVHQYVISLAPGDISNIRGVALGDTLRFRIRFIDPIGNELYNSGIPDTSPNLATGILSARGNYIIGLSNSDEEGIYDYGIGVYTLYVSCTFRDGTVINPGDTAPISTNLNGTSASPAFSGVGFPGLAPVDFSDVARIPMIADVPMTGAVTPTGNEILGYRLDANAGDTLALSFTRLSGNLNLSLVVLSADNKVVFQASLVTSSKLTTEFTLPSAGQYTIGVFRIDLLPPAAPEATAFQVTATLNP